MKTAMKLGNPVQSLTGSLEDAIERQLQGVPSALADTLLGPTPDGRTRTRRPRLDECQVVMFSQCWEARELGFSTVRAEHWVEGETVVVLGPMNDACVYLCGQLHYKLLQPNRRFFLDLAAHSLAGAAECGRYDGRDEPEIECMDYSIEMELSRLQGSMAHGDAAGACMVAGLLRCYARRFDELAERPPGLASAPHATGELLQ
jgi:hypothetical protein